MKQKYRGYKGRRSHIWLKGILALMLVCVLIFGGLLGAVVSGERDQVAGEPAAMIVLGCQVKPTGDPSVLLQDRLDEALAYLADHPDVTVIVSGGKGTNEVISEAQCMFNYLVKQGVEESRILMEDKSTSTYENIANSTALMEQQGLDVEDGVIIVSNGFHLTRARMLWDRITGEGDELSTLAAPTSHLPSRIHMYIREPLALAKALILGK